MTYKLEKSLLISLLLFTIYCTIAPAVSERLYHTGGGVQQCLYVYFGSVFLLFDFYCML